MSTYVEYIGQLNRALEEVGSIPEPPLDADEVELFEEKVKETFGVDLPREFYDLYLHSDGFSDNGVFFYSTDKKDPEDQSLPGLIEQNLLWASDSSKLDGYFFVGHSDLWLYAYHVPTHTCHALNKHSRQSVKKFRGFDDMFTNALKETLNLFVKE